MSRLQVFQDIVMGRRPPITSPYEAQRPLLYYPDLPAASEYDARDFPWTEKLRAGRDTMLTELRRCLEERRGFEPVFPTYASGGRWASLWFMLYGVRYEANCAAFPGSTALVGEIPSQAGWAAISVLEPGTHVRPHCGVTNAKLRLHYALRADSGSRLRVAARYYEWREKEILIFDDSFEHEVWVAGRSPRFVLIADFYHPDLSDEEVEYLRRMEGEPCALLRGRSLRARYQSGVVATRAEGDVDWVYGI